MDQCPLALIDCPFHHAGCDARIFLKDLAEHTEKEAVVHLALLARDKRKSRIEGESDGKRIGV